MHPIRKRRLVISLCILLGVIFATALTLYALKKNINLFYTPSQVLTHPLPEETTFRAGGLVRKHSVHHDPHSLSVRFVITDMKRDLTIEYTGILPDLFREGQGIVAEGYLNHQGIFIAHEVFAKHDEKYMPPQLANSLKAST